MLNIQKFTVNPYQENTYVVSDETRECVIIDCGVLFPEEQMSLTDYITVNQLTPTHLLCTHGHFDHCIGNGLAYQLYGLKPEIARQDEFLLKAIDEQTELFLGMDFDTEQPPVGQYLNDGDVVTFGNHRLTALHTPGHTPGGMIFHCDEEKVVFTGDTLFQMSVGRTDMEGGDWSALMQSLRQVVAKLPADTVVYSGHGPQTTIRQELLQNPFLKD